MEKLKNYIAIQSIVAWRIHWLTLLSREVPESSPDLAFTKEEQKILSRIVTKTKNIKANNLNDFVILLARLGGYLNRKSDSPPGTEVIWRGWLKLNDFIKNLHALQQATGDTYV